MTTPPTTPGLSRTYLPTTGPITDAHLSQLLATTPVRPNPRSVRRLRRLRRFYVDPQSAFTWFVLLPFAFVWCWGAVALLVQKLILIF